MQDGDHTRSRPKTLTEPMLGGPNLRRWTQKDASPRCGSDDLYHVAIVKSLVSTIYGGLLLAASLPLTGGAVLAFGWVEEEPWPPLFFMVLHTLASIGILMKFVPAFALHAALFLFLAIYALVPFDSRNAMMWIAFVVFCVGIALFDLWQARQLVARRKL